MASHRPHDRPPSASPPVGKGPPVPSPASVSGPAQPSRSAGSLCLALLCSALLIVGCDTSVQAIAPSEDRHYSMFGVLNPAQDTQWVRVEPLAEPTSDGAPQDLSVTVTLRNQNTGQTWTLRDSLMEVFRDEYQHNFWTTAPITPSTSYRVTVRNDEGDSTWATTATPAVPPDILIESNILLPCLQTDAANVFDVRLENVEEMAALQIRYFQTFQGSNFTFDFDSYDDAEQVQGGYTAEVNYLDDLETTNRTRDRRCLVDSAKVIAATGGPDWPEWARYNDATVSEIARPDSFTNVEGGHGLVSGVYTDTASVPVVPRDQQ
ncbi:MAG: hypothetical protein ACLFTE_03700 [Salinivenus sp.]